MTAAVRRDDQIADALATLLALLKPEPQPVVSDTHTIRSTRTLLTVEEAAERLGVGRTTAYALVKSGDLESVMIGRLRRIHVDSISAYAARLVERSKEGHRHAS